MFGKPGSGQSVGARQVVGAIVENYCKDYEATEVSLSRAGNIHIQ